MKMILDDNSTYVFQMTTIQFELVQSELLHEAKKLAQRGSKQIRLHLEGNRR